MDWRSIKFDWNRARAFLVTAEEGSISSAARALGMHQPTLSRQINALETELGVVLFERMGRSLSLTPTGLALLKSVQEMGEAAMSLSLNATGQAQLIDGPVCITASELVASHILPTIIRELHNDHPNMKIEIVASNSPGDLRRREADIAIRNFRPTQPDLIATKVGELPGQLYAAKGYLDRLGRPKSRSELASLDFIDFNDTGAYLSFLNDQGFNLTQRNFPVSAENQHVQLELARLGMGIVILPNIIGDADPLLAQVLPTLESMSRPIWLVVHKEVRTSLRIKTAFNYLKRGLSRL